MNGSRINELDLSNCTNMKKIGIMGCNPQSVTISLGNKTDKEISEFDIDVYSADVETSVRFVANREISEIPKVRYEYGYLGYIDGGLKFLKKCVKFIEKNGKIYFKLLQIGIVKMIKFLSKNRYKNEKMKLIGKHS